MVLWIFLCKKIGKICWKKQNKKYNTLKQNKAKHITKRDKCSMALRLFIITFTEYCIRDINRLQLLNDKHTSYCS